MCVTARKMGSQIFISTNGYEFYIKFSKLATFVFELEIFVLKETIYLILNPHDCGIDIVTITEISAKM